MIYNPHTDDDRRKMLDAIGISNASELFKDIPKSIKAPKMDIPGPLSETELRRELSRIASGNCDSACSLFLGAGSYNHYLPAAINYILMRGEFYTAYTPYQPEVSQGMLQAIFEYQTMMCELTGLDVSNASMYDGATALYEAAIMAMRATKLRSKVLVDSSVSPIYREVLNTYAGNLDLDFKVIPAEDGHTDFDALISAIDTDTAGVIVQNPNFFGIVQDFTALAEAAHKSGALLIMSVNPIAAALLKTPAEMGADIAVGEGQPLGSPMFFGGPYIGFLTAREALVRQMPGRIISETVDKDGKRGFVMTLQTREQHIRRAKATSNICTNQGLVALTACIYLGLIGKQGLISLANQNLAKAEYLKKALTDIPGVSLKWNAPTFNEFVITLPQKGNKVTAKLAAEHNIVGGLPLITYFPDMPNDVLVCATEMNTREQVDAYAAVLGRLL